MDSPLELNGFFSPAYQVRVLTETPQVIDHSFHPPGAVPRPDLLLEVTRYEGSSWTGGVRAGSPSVGSPTTGIYATPNPNRVLVVARRDVKPIPRENILLLATPWDVTGIGEDGVLWTTGRLAIDGLRLDESQDGRVAGVADPKDLEPRDFVIDLRTGDHDGGVPFT
jgi:hypothetical protein